ncbi:MAG TPA: hypothetical protein VFC79_05245 [Tissierellaceae bacterium]|nr:hypothetical protein [Tissierellaceae bacterium]
MEIQGTNISMIRGDTQSIIISVKDKDGNKVPLITGDMIYLTVKQSINTEKKVLQKVVTQFEDGNAIIEITPDDTKDIPFRTYVYDIQLNRVDGTVSTIIPPSNFIIGGEVTYE